MLWSQSAYIDRNFKSVKLRPYCPTRVCLINTGPLEVSLTAIATSRKTGESSTRANALPSRSMARFNPEAVASDCMERVTSG